MSVCSPIASRVIVGLVALLVVLLDLTACGKFTAPTPQPSAQPKIDFSQVLQYARRSALVYESDAVIQQTAPPGARITVSLTSPSGEKAYVETDDARKLQWVVVRGTSNFLNIRADVDYNKVLDSRLQVPLHKGFSDTAARVYLFAKPLLKPDYETRVTGHSFGGAAAVIVLMLLKEDGMKLGQAMTFGQPKVTNRAGASKYRALPLLRFVNDKDPVPQLPPLELFVLLDEGPYQHIGPEVVLQEGTKYVYYPEHQAELLSVISFWNTLGNQEVPDHLISSYLANVQQKIPR